MNYRVAILWAALAAGFGGQPPAVGAPAQAPAAPAEERDPLSVPRAYRYAPEGRRDPFVNPIRPQPEAVRAQQAVRPPGLPGVALNEAQLMGVVISSEPAMNAVVILAPGGRTFFAAPGDELFDVVVKQIRTDSVVFEVKPLTGESGSRPREEVVRPLNATPGE